MIVLLAAALIGGSVTFTVLCWLYGVLLALVGVAFGASFSAFVAGLLLAFLRTRAEQRREHSIRTDDKAAA